MNCKTCQSKMEDIIYGSWECLKCYPNKDGERMVEYFARPMKSTKIDRLRTVNARTQEEKEYIIEKMHAKYILAETGLELRV